jgi:hypothetical protein
MFQGTSADDIPKSANYELPVWPPNEEIELTYHHHPLDQKERSLEELHCESTQFAGHKRLIHQKQPREF